MPITKVQALDICKAGKFYRQNTNRAGIPERNIFCDYCNQSGLMGSWKIIDTYDLCNNCYISLQSLIKQNSFLPIAAQKKPYESLISSENEPVLQHNYYAESMQKMQNGNGNGMNGMNNMNNMNGIQGMNSMMESMNINGVPHNFPSISGNNVGNSKCNNNMNGNIIRKNGEGVDGLDNRINNDMNSRNEQSSYFDMFSLPLADFQK
jgi:hypothetical protein